MSFSFYSLERTDAEALTRLCSAAAEPDRHLTLVRECLQDGTVRPEWCMWAQDSGGAVVAGMSWWAAPGTEVPVLVDLLGVADVEAAVELLRYGRERLQVREAESMVVVPHDASAVRGSSARTDAEVLTRAGFAVEVERVRIEWNGATPADPGRLTYRRAGDLPDSALIELFAAVGDASLDNNMRRQRARHGRDGEARRRLERAGHYGGEQDWFSVGVDASGAHVGYVVAGLVNGDRPVLAEIGVAADYRGRRYVDDLLAHGTAILQRHGAERIRSDTDAANTPMRAAFARGNYREFAVRTDYHWDDFEATSPANQ